jgi:hypothetical protein
MSPNGSAEWRTDPALSRNFEATAFRRWSVHAGLKRTTKARKLAKSCGASRENVRSAPPILMRDANRARWAVTHSIAL